jgi:hypothetical protein
MREEMATTLNHKASRNAPNSVLPISMLSWTKTYLINTCRSLVCSKLKNLTTGLLIINETGFGVHEYGSKKNGHVVEIQVAKDHFWLRTLVFGAMVTFLLLLFSST